MSVVPFRPSDTRPDITNAAIKRINKKKKLGEAVIRDIDEMLSDGCKLRAEMHYDGQPIKEISSYIEHLLNMKRDK